ncbi:MAG: peptidylprolyl isomerase [Nostocales cyanobacterium]|nr:MAG: peptidylprolyl isomerase [Nostocales cyanobacterium]TAF18528.1 MAG: peptidylprolyl isomerase [Nostocales cyanobacterium]
MESSSFLTINDKQIELAQVVKYLQVSGKLNQFISDVLRQHILETEIATRNDIDVSTALIEQSIIDFRLRNQLTDPEQFKNWLQNNGSDYATFYESVTFSFKLEKLKAVITEPKLPEYFIERKIYLDRVVLSRIMVDNRELIEELRTQIEEGSSFEQLAKEYSVAEEKTFNGMMGPISRGSLPDILRAPIDAANPGELIGPIELEGLFSLFRLESIIPASLENNQLKQSLQTELFEKWIGEKIQNLTVKLQVN